MYPLTLIATTDRIRRIPDHTHHRRIPLDLIGFISFSTQPVGKQGAGICMVLFETVGEIDLEALIGGWLIACLCEQQIKLEMRHGI